MPALADIAPAPKATFATDQDTQANMPQVEEINQLDDLLRLRLIWNALLHKTPGATFFQSLDWLQVYWRHFAARQRLRVLLVISAGEPIGLLPLVVKREATRIGRLRTLTWPLDGWGTFYGPIGPNPAATLMAGMKHIRQTRRDWDLIDLRWLHPDHDRGRAANALRMAAFPCQTTSWAPSR